MSHAVRRRLRWLVIVLGLAAASAGVGAIVGGLPGVFV